MRNARKLHDAARLKMERLLTGHGKVLHFLSRLSLVCMWASFQSQLQPLFITPTKKKKEKEQCKWDSCRSLLLKCVNILIVYRVALYSSPGYSIVHLYIGLFCFVGLFDMKTSCTSDRSVQTLPVKYHVFQNIQLRSVVYLRRIIPC